MSHVKITLPAYEIQDGYQKLVQLSKLRVRGHTMGISLTRQNLKNALLPVEQAQNDARARHIRKGPDDRTIPICTTSLDFTRYAGHWSKERTYPKGAIVVKDELFYDAKMETEEEPGKSDDWSVFGAKGKGVYADQFALQEELSEIQKWELEVKLYPFPLDVWEKLEEQEDFTAEMVWTFMIAEIVDDAPVEVERAAEPIANGQAVEAEA